MTVQREAARVIVADDQPAFREAAREVIAETNGLQLVAVSDRASCLPRLVDETAADVLLLDVRIPGEDTIAVATALRHSRPRLTVVLVSADSILDIPEEVFALGIGFIAKEELTPETLADMLRRHSPGHEDKPGCDG